jgi:hypothetical protein
VVRLLRRRAARQVRVRVSVSVSVRGRVRGRLTLTLTLTSWMPPADELAQLVNAQTCNVFSLWLPDYSSYG